MFWEGIQVKDGVVQLVTMVISATIPIQKLPSEIKEAQYHSRVPIRSGGRALEQLNMGKHAHD